MTLGRGSKMKGYQHFVVQEGLKMRTKRGVEDENEKGG
jgi:hypothetical protein